ncbi:pyrophosphatase [Rhizobium rhizosphaerae]|uniref:Pyrophosphatase n=1 Tax=Xaviernesmea rhizosphaerae TaxID=1672749 RepID=A0ABX3PIU6_9HYPH|nr:pyrophosphatase [Xaviernesmea rhizosphaerae]OQP88139.1 pyrophosphatase [Xaviernesmea rhizosphaerae]
MLTDLMQRFETASSLYAEANGLTRDDDWFMLKLQEEMGELTQAWNRVSGRSRAKGRDAQTMARDLADETADVLGHILLLAHRHGLDLEAAIARKWLFDPSANTAPNASATS